MFDSYRKYESEYEQELNVQPEKLVKEEDFSDSESNGYSLKIELRQCEYASNTSSAMTPRIIMEQERKKFEVTNKVNAEIDFTGSFSNSRLSPEQISRIRVLTKERLKETPQKFNDSEVLHYSMMESRGHLDSFALDSDRAARRRQIIERLEHLL